MMEERGKGENEHMQDSLTLTSAKRKREDDPPHFLPNYDVRRQDGSADALLDSSLQENLQVKASLPVNDTLPIYNDPGSTCGSKILDSLPKNVFILALPSQHMLHSISPTAGTIRSTSKLDSLVVSDLAEKGVKLVPGASSKPPSSAPLMISKTNEKIKELQEIIQAVRVGLLKPQEASPKLRVLLGIFDPIETLIKKIPSLESLQEAVMALKGALILQYGKGTEVDEKLKSASRILSKVGTREISETIHIKALRNLFKSPDRLLDLMKRVSNRKLPVCEAVWAIYDSTVLATGEKGPLKVKDIMKKPEEHTLCKEGDRIIDRLVRLKNKGCWCLLVLDDSHRLVGIFTDGDLRHILEASRKNFFRLSLGQTCSRDPVTIGPDAMVVEALEKMESLPTPVNFVPVTDCQNFVVGLLPLHGLLSADGRA